MTPQPTTPPASALASEGVSWDLAFTWPAPPWFVVVTVFGLLALIAWLYAHEAGRVRPPLRAAMAVLRLAALAVLAVMLSGVSLARYRTGQPALALVVDRSASMATVDAAAGKAAAAATDKSGPTRLELVQKHLSASRGAVLRQLRQGRALVEYALAEQATWLPDSKGDNALAKLEPTGAATRLGDGVQNVLDDLRGRSPTAIVLFTDGVNTAGQPLAAAAQAAQERGVPLFLVGVGDDTPPEDLELAEVLADEAVFTGDVVNFQVELRHTGLAGRSIEVRLRRSDSEEPLAKTTATLGEEALQSVLLSYRPESTGRYAFVLEAVPVEGEENVDNNRRPVEVDVRDDRVKVLYVQGPPSFEYRFLKALLERDERFELACVLQEADPEALSQDRAMLPSFPLAPEDLQAFDVIVWGDVDPARLPPGALDQVRELVVERGRGLVFSSGPRHTPMAYADTVFEPLSPLPLATAQVPSPEDQIKDPAAMAAGEQLAAAPFLALAAPAGNAAALQALPPVYWRVESREVRPATRVFARFAQAKEAGNTPAIAAQYVGAGEVVLIATDEIWRWRREQHEAEYARFWVQLLRYLARAKLRSGDGGVELTADRDRYLPGEPVWLRARFRDPELAPASDQLNVDVVLPDGRSEAVTLNRRGSDRGAFGAALRFELPGAYRAQLESDERPATAEFAIEPPLSEADRTTADFRVLAEAAALSGGRFYRLEEAGRLPRDLPEARSAPIEPLPPAPLWNRWPLLLAFVLLLSGEWLLRKQQGLV